MQVDDKGARQDVRCYACGFEWRDLYRLSDVEPIED